LAASCIAGNATYYGADGSMLSEAEYDAACTEKAIEINGLSRYLRGNPHNPVSRQSLSLADSPKSDPLKSSDNNSIAIAQGASGQVETEKESNGNDENESEDEYDDEYSDEADVELIPDPWIQMNTGFYHFNDKMYFWVLKPVARGYGFIIPEELRQAIRNVFYNIRFPVRFINCLLQGKGRKAGAEFGQFFINTTVGFAGLQNVAANYPALQPSKEDLGQTFAVWGFDNGAYLTLPFFGPSSLRDGLGLVGDIFLDPFWWFVDDVWVSVAIRGGETVNDTSLRIGEYEALKEAAIDPYVMIRNAYVQNRNKLIEE
jgi:phospholipid-binding lipoprotein MlaA